MRDKQQWWHPKCDDPAARLFERVRSLDNALAPRRERNRENMSRYLNRSFAAMRPGESTGFSEVYDDLTLNLCHSAVATVVSKIGMHRPFPRVITSNGKYEDQEKGRLLEKFGKGVFTQNAVYTEVSPQVLTDAAVFDFGAAKVFSCDGRIFVERVLPDEFLWDEEAARTSPPRELIQVKFIKKEVLAAQFPKHRTAIEAANTIPDAQSFELTDLIEVAESWHLPSKPGAGDGKHVIAINNAKLYEGDWTRDGFPFVFIRWDRKPVGFSGQGLVEQLAPIQDELDKMIRRVQESMHLNTVQLIVIDKASNINKRHLKNAPGIIVEKHGGPDPKIVTPPGINPQYFQYMDYLWSKGFEIAGVSQLSAHSQLPERMRGTGEAIRSLLDTETQRFALLTREWEQFHLDLADLIFQEAADMHAGGEKIEVCYSDREWMERINWSKCSLSDNYTLEIHSTSTLPQSVSGKMALVEQLTGMGAIQDPGIVLELLQMPDVDKYASTKTANLRNAHRIAEHLLSSADNWIEPEEFFNLQLCIQIANEHYVKGHLEGVPDDRLDNLAAWIKAAMQTMKDAQQRAQAEAMAAQAAAQPPQGQMPERQDAAPSPEGVPINDVSLAA